MTQEKKGANQGCSPSPSYSWIPLTGWDDIIHIHLGLFSLDNTLWKSPRLIQKCLLTKDLGIPYCDGIDNGNR